MRPLLFYNDWPLHYVNQEGERKARAFAAAGHDVTWMTGAGTRNPRASRIGKLAAFALRAAREQTVEGPEEALDVTSLIVAPPRQRARVRRFNAAWTRRQLRAAVPDWPEAVAWVRHATPELVDALEADPPASVVYEVIDAHHAGPGMTGVWRGIFEDAERRLVALADAVVITNEPLAPRFEAQGVTVHRVPHGVDLHPWNPSPPEGPVTLGFLGVLDGRLDIAVLRHVAAQRPAWRIRLVGPVAPGFEASSLADLPNLSIEPAVAHDRIGEVIGTFHVGLLAYADLPAYAGGFPLKLLELFAAGRPVVVRPNAAVAPLADLVRFARTPQEFLDALDETLAHDDAAAAQARRAHAEARSWDAVCDELVALVAELPSRSRG